MITKILIVEDNPSVRRVIRDLVAPLAEEVQECADGAEALTAYATHRPDFVLMDIAIGEADGIAATARIVTAHPAAKVIIVTSYDGADLRQAASEAGACGYVLKDNLLELRRLLRPAT
jgi:CheY-like chemotaxis protein